jgi:hypothetical protein
MFILLRMVLGSSERNMTHDGEEMKLFSECSDLLYVVVFVYVVKFQYTWLFLFKVFKTSRQ